MNTEICVKLLLKWIDASVISLWAVIFLNRTAAPTVVLPFRFWFKKLLASKSTAVSFYEFTVGFFVWISHASSRIGRRVEPIKIVISEPSLKNDRFLFWFVLAVIECFDCGRIVSYSFSMLYFAFIILKVLP